MEILNRKINETSKPSKKCNLGDHNNLRCLVTNARKNIDLTGIRNECVLVYEHNLISPIYHSIFFQTGHYSINWALFYKK